MSETSERVESILRRQEEWDELQHSLREEDRLGEWAGKQDKGAISAAASRIADKARGLWSRHVQFDPQASLRPLAKVQAMLECGERLARLRRRPVYNASNPSTRVSREVAACEEEHRNLCEDLGASEDVTDPGRKVMLDIATAPEGMRAPTHKRRPKGWPPDRPWLHESPPWDPDYYIALAVEPTLRAETLVLPPELVDLLEVAFAVQLAVSRDRSRLKLVMDLAKLNPSQQCEAGSTLDKLEDIRKSGRSSVRWWLRQWHDRRIPLNECAPVTKHAPDDEWRMRCRIAFDSDILAVSRAALKLAQRLNDGDHGVLVPQVHSEDPGVSAPTPQGFTDRRWKLVQLLATWKSERHEGDPTTPNLAPLLDIGSKSVETDLKWLRERATPLVEMGQRHGHSLNAAGHEFYQVNS